MNRNLHVAAINTFTLPPDTVTSTCVVYGGKGMGKTNFGAVVAEEVFASGLRFSVIARSPLQLRRAALAPRLARPRATSRARNARTRRVSDRKDSAIVNANRKPEFAGPRSRRRS